MYSQFFKHQLLWRKVFSDSVYLILNDKLGYSDAWTFFQEYYKQGEY